MFKYKTDHDELNVSNFLNYKDNDNNVRTKVLLVKYYWEHEK